MRAAPIFLAVALLASCASQPDGSGDGGARVDAASDAATAVTGRDLLIYYGSGGIAPLPTDPPQDSFENLRGLLPGRTLVHTDTWPDSLERFGLVMLVLPGATNAGAGLSAAERGRIDDWVERGGSLVVLADWGIVIEQYNLIDANRASMTLLGQLGLPVTITGDRLDDFTIPMRAGHPLTVGVDHLSCGGYTPLLFTPSGTVARLDNAQDGAGPPAVLGTQRGRGWVVLVADIQCFDDAVMHGAETTAFIENLIGR